MTSLSSGKVEDVFANDFALVLTRPGVDVTKVFSFTSDHIHLLSGYIRPCGFKVGGG